MKESKFIGSLLPSHPDLVLIIQAIRDKYGLSEISPDDDPIREIYLGDEIISLEEFRNNIENLVRENLNNISHPSVKYYLNLKRIIEANPYHELESLPDATKNMMTNFVNSMKLMVEPIIQMLDAQITNLVDNLYSYLLTGENKEIPEDWISRVTAVNITGNPMILVLVSQLANPDVIVQQFRSVYNKTFGTYHPTITDTTMTTAYYLKLKKMGKPWNFLVEEYIRRSKIKLPRDRTSKKYIESYRRVEQRLKKRIQRTENILNVIVRDIK